MTVAYDASSSSSTGTGNLSWTHTPTGTPKGVWVSVLQYNTFGDEVTSVTYGGVAMTETADSPYADNSTEDSAIYSYYLGSSIPTGAQTVVVTVSGASSKQACAITVTAATDTEVQDTATHVATSDATTTTLALGGNSSFCALAFMSASNIATSTAPISGWTQQLETDFGNEVGGVHTYDTVGTSDVSFSISNTTVRRIALGVAITESAGAGTVDLAGDAAAVATATGDLSGGTVPDNTITSTELGATGQYVYFDQAAFDDLGSQTVLAYCRPTGSGGGGYAYIYGKTPTGSINGPRFFIDHNAGAPRLIFGANSSTAGTPQRMAAADSAVYNSWGHYAATWDGSLTGANILLYAGVGTDVSETSYGTTDNGSGSVTSDAANPAYLMNRYGLGREFVGDVAYIAVWDSVLTLTQLQNAQNNGPLEEPTGLVLLWANQADLSTNALTETGRSTYAAGAIPPNTLLGGDAVVDLAGTAAAVASATGELESSTVDLAGAAAATASATGDLSAGPVIVIADDFERSSVNVAGSSISGAGDSAIVTLKPRVQESEVVSSQTRWLTPLAKVTGVNGFRPTFLFSDYGSGAGKYHGYPWEAGRKPMFAYSIDGPWYYFDTTTINASNITFRHNTTFTADTVYISKGRVRTPTQTGAWITGLESTYPSLIHNVTSNTSGFVSGTFAAQTDELSRAIPAQPFYAFKISDASLTPAYGDKKAMVLVAGVHGGEDQGDLTLKAAVEFLLSADAKAQNVRQHFDVWVYPLLNAPGRAGGGWRGSFTQGAAGIDDANRHFSDASPGLEIITLPRAAMTADLPAYVPVMIDFHGQYADKYGLYQDTAVAEHTTFDAAMEVYLGSGQYINIGVSNAGFVAKYFNSTYSTPYYLTTELGDPTAITDANIVTFGEAHIKAVSDMQDAGRFGDMLHGTAAATAVATGELTHAVPLVAAAVSLATATGALSQSVPLTGNATASASASGGLSLSIPLTGVAAAVAASTGAISINVSLSGSAIAQAAASAGLTVESVGSAALEGNAHAVAAASGALSIAIPLSGAALTVSSASGNLTQIVPLTGSAASASLATGGLDVAVNLSGSALVEALAAAGLSVDGGLSGAAAGEATGSGTLTLHISLSGDAIANASASGALTAAGLIVEATPGWSVSAPARSWKIDAPTRSWRIAS